MLGGKWNNNKNKIKTHGKHSMYGLKNIKYMVPTRVYPGTYTFLEKAIMC